MGQLLRVLVGIGLALTEPRQRRRIYKRVSDRLEDLADHASRGYETAADRVEDLYHAARGEDHSVLASAASFLIGVGVGAGAGLLLAPASGKETRANIADKFQDFRSDVRESLRNDMTEPRTA